MDLDPPSKAAIIDKDDRDDDAVESVSESSASPRRSIDYASDPFDETEDHEPGRGYRGPPLELVSDASESDEWGVVDETAQVGASSAALPGTPEEDEEAVDEAEEEGRVQGSTSKITLGQFVQGEGGSAVPSAGGASTDLSSLPSPSKKPKVGRDSCCAALTDL